MIHSPMTEMTPPLAEVLILDHVSDPVGYRLGGSRAGPEIVVIGHGDTTTAVYQRLLKVPTFGQIKGRLTLLEIDKFPDMQTDTLRQVINADHTDHLVMLPYQKAGIDTVSDGYWTVLEACAELGAISTRGIPTSRIRTQQANFG